MFRSLLVLFLLVSNASVVSADLALPAVDSVSTGAPLELLASEFTLKGSGYYLDKGKWLAIHPDKNRTAVVKQASPFPSGRYDVTLHAVGEEDGRSFYLVECNDAKLGDFECPLSDAAMEEGEHYQKTWPNVSVESGDIIAVRSTVASSDRKEFSRGRWARLTFKPADAATMAKIENLEPKAAPINADVKLVQPRLPDGQGAVKVTGEMKQWHKVTLALDGPFADEMDNDPNPFMDRDFTVTFTHESGEPKYQIPGYFAADGDAAESSATRGAIWHAHLSPDKAGTWNYVISFKTGKQASLDGGGEAFAPYHGKRGSFTIAPTDKSGRDLRGKGRLEYVDKHHLQFAGSKEYFLKAGTDAPETLLAYADFDQTTAPKANSPLKTWAPHVQDWQAGDPTWKNGKGKGLVGALNYLASKGVNAFSFLTYNAGGDGDNVWPFVSRNDKLHRDCSKLDQWGIIFDHATAKGLYLHFKLQENENDDDRRGGGGVGGKSVTGRPVPESLDGGKLGPQRKLYCRELVARYGHNLALNWNIGEENTQSTGEIKEMIHYLKATDPYSHHIVIHTFIPQQDAIYTPLLGKQSELTGASLQNHWDATHQRTLKWVTESAAAGKPWIVANDEQGGADTGVPPDPGYGGYNGKKKDGKPVQTVSDIRKATLWGNLMAGGAGVEYYFGYQLPQNDLNAEDWRSRDESWNYARIAVEFFPANRIPFWEMKNANALIDNPTNDHSKYCLAKAGEVYLVFLPEGGTTDLDLTGLDGEFTVKWFNPRTGGALQDGSVNSLNGGGRESVGQQPQDPGQDWLAVIRR